MPKLKTHTGAKKRFNLTKTGKVKRGMPPKTLQKLLGHASIKTTMDRYVHVTDESLVAGVRQFEQGQQTITPSEQGERNGNSKNPDSAA